MPTLRRALLVATVLALIGAFVSLGDVSSPPRSIHFGKGKASALLQGLLPKIDDAAPQAAAPKEYLLHARAGQVMTIKFTGLDQGAAFSISCPGGGRMDVGRSPLWSSVLPVSGDYRVVVERRREGAPVVPFALEVGVAGKPGPVEPRGVTGFYQFGKSGYPSLEVLELPEGQIKFVLYSQSGEVVANGPAQIREISGTVPLRDGTAVHQVEGCKRTLTFGRNGVRVLEEGECGARENLATFDGAYRKVSPCGNPAKPTTAGQAVVGGA
ncbi:MAG TPA: hypothetical protein VIE43_13845 [Thermoanaerobaculia bacterium]|jgi:hypothetical protein|nr:hypothetical protein [Thermoanaerobaculia bacterium]